MKTLREAFNTGNMPKGRIEAFSDGVIAVAITLLVLEIKLPHPESVSPELLGSALIALFPKLLCYFVAFLFITIWWVAHHQLFQIIRRADRGLLWLNSLFLMCLAFFPFPTALLGEYYAQPFAAVVFGATAFTTGMTFWIMRWYVSVQAKLIDPDIPRELLRNGLRRGAMSPILYGMATIIGWFRPTLALGLFVVIPFYYFIPGLLDKHRPGSMTDSNGAESRIEGDRT